VGGDRRHSLFAGDARRALRSQSQFEAHECVYGNLCLGCENWFTPHAEVLVVGVRGHRYGGLLMRRARCLPATAPQ
jgi:hypothetical protein